MRHLQFFVSEAADDLREVRITLRIIQVVYRLDVGLHESLVRHLGHTL